jgi:DNA-binding FadR family transcriptional regulator
VTDATHEVERQPKLAERIAQQVEQEIIEAGWPVGAPLGSEAILAKRYGVSRAIMREAARLLEHHVAATTRRGVGGGLIVARPDLRAVLPAISLCLDFEGVSPGTLLEARSAIELAAVELAAERITDAGKQRLQTALDFEGTELSDPHKYLSSHDLHILIADLSGNPALRLFVAILTRLTSAHAQTRFSEVEHTEAEAIGREIADAHASIVKAIVKGNVGIARKCMRSHLEAIAPWLT